MDRHANRSTDIVSYRPTELRLRNLKGILSYTQQSHSPQRMIAAHALLVAQLTKDLWIVRWMDLIKIASLATEVSKISTTPLQCLLL